MSESARLPEVRGRLFAAGLMASLALTACGLKTDTENIAPAGLIDTADVVAPQVINPLTLVDAPRPTPPTPTKARKQPAKTEVLCERTVTPVMQAQSFDNLPDYVRHYQPLARKVERACRVPVAVILAQSYLESDGAASGLAQESKNLFGIKAKRGPFAGWDGAVKVYPTLEHYTATQVSTLVDSRPYCPPNPQRIGQNIFKVTVCDAFRQYNSPEESFMDYGYHLRFRGEDAPGEFYADAFSSDDPQRFIRDILDDDDGPDGPQKRYATDKDYIAKISPIISEVERHLQD